MSAVIEQDSMACYIYTVFCWDNSCYRAKLENYEPTAKMRC